MEKENKIVIGLTLLCIVLIIGLFVFGYDFPEPQLDVEEKSVEERLDSIERTIRRLKENLGLVEVDVEGSCSLSGNYPCLHGIYDEGSIEDQLFNVYECDRHEEIGLGMRIAKYEKCDELLEKFHAPQ